MINLNKIALGLIALLCGSIFTACTAQEDTLGDMTEAESAQKHTCEMVLNGSKAAYSDEPQTRSAAAWEAGDKIYLKFSVGNTITHGDAVYNGTKWTVSYYGSLTKGTMEKCTAVYFDNADYESGSMVNLTEKTAIYEDMAGSYTFDGSTLSVTADLKPKTARIRFSGTDGKEVTLVGMTYYNGYDASNGTFTTSNSAVKESVTNGYTPYVYGYFADETAPRLNLIVTAGSGFNRMISSSYFKPGESGYMKIPSTSDYTGWKNMVVLKVNGVEFNMIPVTYAGGNFLMAETETTEALYKAVMGGTTNNPLLPATGVSNWTDFLTKISSLTGLELRMPTKDEWIWAAKGGNRSKGFTYAGSNILDEVGWYNGNASYIHDVKQKKPNELGFYDMSGNAAETTSTIDYSIYSFDMGGYYNSNASQCTVTSANSSTSYLSCTIRLTLSNK